MIIITNNQQVASELIFEIINWKTINISDLENEAIRNLVGNLIEDGAVYFAEISSSYRWNYLFIVDFAQRSQFDILNEFASNNSQLPDGILCYAASGNNFHGFHNRKWEALKGNIHLSAYVKPEQEIPKFHIGFTVMTAVTVLNTLESFSRLNGAAGIKWLNDILINDKKVAGVLANTQLLGSQVRSAIIGIGLNVESKPERITDPVVRAATSMWEHFAVHSAIDVKRVFNRLIGLLDANYSMLIDDKLHLLLKQYLQRSVIVGRNIQIVSDNFGINNDFLIEGRVERIDEDLNIYLENFDEPINKGRVIIK